MGLDAPQGLNMITQLNTDTGVTEILVDRRNFHSLAGEIYNRIETATSDFIGFDIESQDENRHDGLNKFMAINPKATEYKKPSRLIFDTERTVITGFSVYIQHDNVVFYFNLAHADVENRLDLQDVRPILELIKAKKTWVIHNAAYEIGICRKSWGFDIGQNYICSMQLCVSAYNTDEYDIQKFKDMDLGPMAVLIPEIAKTFAGYDGKARLTAKQNELLNKVLGKQSKAAFSYNGFVKNIAYGYALKKAVKSWFGYNQGSFEDCLQGKLNMGHLTGEEVLHYGADDAYWCVKLFERVWRFMNDTNPQVVRTFVEQENPMPYIWADTWVRGVRLNKEQLDFRILEQRVTFSEALRKMIDYMRRFEFSPEACPRLKANQDWYYGSPPKKPAKKPKPFVPKYIATRQRFLNIMEAYDDSLSNYEVSQLVSGAISENWALELGNKVDKSKGNISHYMMVRVLCHDLMDLPLVKIKGKYASDAASRGEMTKLAHKLATDPMEWIKQFARDGVYKDLTDDQRMAIAERKMVQFDLEAVLGVLDCLNTLAGVDQTMKLYLNPYQMLVDPDTNRVHPVISSLLNTRRMGCKNPNGMQLAKRGDSVFVRGFFLPERDDHLIVCIDWSQIELVLIGEDSKDPRFFEAYGHIPYKDLHLGAAASAIRVYHPDFTNDNLKNVGGLSEADLMTFKLTFPKAFTDPITNTELSQDKVAKFWRNKAGKVSNFGYWYSGSLMTVQPNLGWSMDEMWAATENYRQQFPIAEAWRVRTQLEAKMYGFVYIFDGHRRTRYEATREWYQVMLSKFSSYGNPAVTAFGQKVCTSIQRRAANQVVNAKIQGGCAPLAKLSIKKLWDEIRQDGWDADFMLPIHDELVFSAHHSQAIDFAYRVRDVMCNHPQFVNWLKLDGTISIGKTLEPYHEKKAPLGQIELQEAPFIKGVLDPETYGKELGREDQEKVVNYLMTSNAKPTLE